MIALAKPTELYAVKAIAVLAANVERHRDRLGMSEREMTRLAGIDNNGWRRATSPEAARGPTIDSVAKVADVLGVTLASLLDDDMS